jgi:hypothetical protein
MNVSMSLPGVSLLADKTRVRSVLGPTFSLIYLSVLSRAYPQKKTGKN